MFQRVPDWEAALQTGCLEVFNIFPSVCVIKYWFCVEAEVTTCLLEKEEDTCTEKVLVAYFICY